MEPQATLEFLKDHVGKLLDPRVYAALCSVVGRRQTLTFIDS
jgi:hypothetical protein